MSAKGPGLAHSVPVRPRDGCGFDTNSRKHLGELCDLLIGIDAQAWLADVLARIPSGLPVIRIRAPVTDSISITGDQPPPGAAADAIRAGTNPIPTPDAQPPSRLGLGG